MSDMFSVWCPVTMRSCCNVGCCVAGCVNMHGSGYLPSVAYQPMDNAFPTKKLKRAQDYAAEVRARKPQMQVKKA